MAHPQHPQHPTPEALLALSSGPHGSDVAIIPDISALEPFLLLVGAGGGP